MHIPALILLVGIPLVFYLGRMLTRHGASWLADVYESPDVSRSVNNLLAIGFSLFAGAITFAQVRYRTGVTEAQQTEMFLSNLSVVLAELAALFFFHLFVLYIMRGRVRRQQAVEANLGMPKPTGTL